MREPIDTAKRDGHYLILEDCVRHICDVARWSNEDAIWLWENGQPAAFVSSRWSSATPELPPSQIDEDQQGGVQQASPRRRLLSDLTKFVRNPVGAQERLQKPSARRLTRSTIAIGSVLVGAAAAALPAVRHGETFTNLAQYFRVPQQPEIAAIWQQFADRAVQLANDSWRPRQHPSGDAASAGSLLEQATLEQARRDAALAQEQLANIDARHRRELDEERARTSAITADLAEARDEIGRQSQQLREAGDNAAQLDVAAQSRVSALEAALRAERDKAATLASDLANVRRDLENETVRSAKVAEDAAVIRKRSEVAVSKLQDWLQQEQDSNESLKAELTAARLELSNQVALVAQLREDAARLAHSAETSQAAPHPAQRNGDDRAETTAALTTTEAALERWSAKVTVVAAQIARPASTAARGSETRIAKPVAGAAPTSLAAPLRIAPAAAVSDPESPSPKADPETDRLIARAKMLLTQGNIGAARAVLERAAETGSARAIFVLAQTYDPAVLASWSTYGTRGDIAKARALYARASADGIREAQARVEALDQ